MGDVIHGFTVVALIIVAGFAVARTGVLGSHAEKVLSALVFNVTTPALIITHTATTRPAELFSPLFFVIVAAEMVMFVLVAVGYRLVGRTRWDRAIFAGMSTSYVNAANLGIPFAVYILSDAHPAVLAIVFQTSLYAPFALLLVDASRGRHASDTRARGRNRWAPLKNPIVIAAAIGIAVSLTGVTIPSMIFDPLQLLSDAAVGLALIFFGVSLSSTTFLEKGAVSRREAAGLSVAKSILHPVVGWGLLRLWGWIPPVSSRRGSWGRCPPRKTCSCTPRSTTPHRTLLGMCPSSPRWRRFLSCSSLRWFWGRGSSHRSEKSSAPTPNMY